MNLNEYAAQSHADNRQWWYTPKGTLLERNRGELLMLIVSEIAEAMEGERKDLMDNHLFPGTAIWRFFSGLFFLTGTRTSCRP